MLFIISLEYMLTVISQEEMDRYCRPERAAVELDLIAHHMDHDISKYNDDDRNKAENETSLEQVTEHIQASEAGSTTLAPGQFLQGTGFRARTLVETSQLWRDYASLRKAYDVCDQRQPDPPKISLTSQDITRWRMAWRTFQLFNLHRSKEAFDKYKEREVLIPRFKDWPGMALDDLSVALGLSAAAIVYGGLHALAWYAHFDSSTERLLWRISASVVMGGLPIIFVLDTCADRIDDLDLSLRYSIILASAFYAVLLAYILARGYLVVECFISLSHLPSGVYDVPNWATYFPHIS